MSSSRSRSPRLTRSSKQHYYLRSRSDKESSTSTTLSTVSPTSPLTSTSPTPITALNQEEFKEFTTITSSNPIKNRMTRKRRRSTNLRTRKRKFSQTIDTESDHDQSDDDSDIEHEHNKNQDIDINIDTVSTSTINNRPRRKKAKYSRTIKFTLSKSKFRGSDTINTKIATKPPSNTTFSNSAAPPPSTSTSSIAPSQPRKYKPKRIRLTFKNNPKHVHTQNDEKVISREASLKPSSPLLTKRRRHYPRIEEFEIVITSRSTRRNPYICCYQFFSGYKIGISMTLGARNDVKAAIKILSQELVSTRAKASIQTHKNTFLLYIKTRKDKMIGCSIVHVDNILKRVNIEMFAVDESWRGNGFASMMVYLIQYRMINWTGYDLFVCAADSAVPFWSNKKYNFVHAHKSLLEQHEVEDEKHGNTKHMIWYGTPIQARCALLNCFVQSSQ